MNKEESGYNDIFIWNKNTILFVFSMIVYILYSIIMLSQKIPFFDEVNAWNIAANCNFSELLEVCKHEGHFILWYLMIKPFAVYNIGFPQSIFALNWIIAFSSVLVLWFKAPFNPWLKMAITFSLPMQMFTIYARCYAIGVLILFILCSIYKERVKHPVIYSLLIVLLANTSVIGAIAAFCLGILYLSELVILIKNKSAEYSVVLKPIGIYIFGVFIVLAQMANYAVPTYSQDKNYLINTFIDFFRICGYIPKDLAETLFECLFITGVLFFKKDRIPYFFLVLSSSMILFIALNVYVLACWHYMFLFIFFVCAIWMYLSEHNITVISQKIYYILFCIMSFLTIFFFKFPWHWNGFAFPTAYYIKEQIQEYENSRIFLFPTDSSVIGIVPLLREYKIDFYDAKGYSYKTANAYIHQWDKQKVDFEGMGLIADNNKNNYLFVTTAEKFKKDLDFFVSLESSKNNKLIFLPYKKMNDVMIYKIYLKNESNEQEKTD